MTDVLDYRILRAEIHSTDDRKGAMETAITKLERQVQTLLADGWEPLGGVCAEHILAMHIYAYSQAMVLRKLSNVL